MDSSTKKQIDNILKNNSLDPTLFKFIKMNDNIFKMCYTNILVTYIKLYNINLTNQQTVNWKPYRNNLVKYAQKLEKFNFDVVAIVDVVSTDSNDDIFNRCINSLLNQSNEPYIILIVTNHQEKQIAISYNIDFYWSVEKNVNTRFNNCLSYVRGNFKFVNNVMLCNSNNVFLKDWISNGVKKIDDKVMVSGKNYKYVLDEETGNSYKHSNNSSNSPLTDGLIINKAVLNKIGWIVFTKDKEFIPDNLIKHIAVLETGLINGSDVVTVFSKITDLNFKLKLEPVTRLPTNDISNSKIIPKIKSKIIPKIKPKSTSNSKSTSKSNSKLNSNSDDIVINPKSESKPKKIVSIPVIMQKPKVEEIKVEKLRYMIPTERVDKPEVVIPQIIVKKSVDLPKIKTGTVILAPIRQQMLEPLIEIPLIVNKKLASDIILNTNNTNNIKLTLESPKRIATFIIVNSNLNGVELCVNCLTKQSVNTDIFIILENSLQKDIIDKDKLKVNYICSESPNIHIRIQNALKTVSKLNPNYVCFVEDAHCLGENWLESAVTQVEQNFYDVIGSNQSYLYNSTDSSKHRLELIQDNLNFVSKHYRPVWSLSGGRVLTKSLLDKLNWELFSGNYDVDIEVSLAIKLIKVGAKLGLIKELSLHYTTTSMLKTVNSVNYLKTVKLEHRSEEMKNLHKNFNKLLGEYSTINIPMIQPKYEPQTVDYRFRKSFNYMNTNSFVNDAVHDVAVSITLPTLNGMPHIQTVVECVLKQSFKDYELIIVNDGSTQPELKEYLLKISKSNHQIKLINLPKNGGLPAALNVGIKLSKGKYWTWISDDNTISTDFLYELKQKLDQGYGFVYSNYTLIDSISHGFPVANIKLRYNTVLDVVDRWRGMPSYMWRRELIDQIGFFDETIQGCEDFEFVVKTFIGCNDVVAYTDKSLFTYYKRTDTLTTKLKDVIPKLKEETRLKYRFATVLQQLHHILYNKNKNKEIMLYVSDVDYFKLFQRPQQFMKLLSKDYECVFIGKLKDLDVYKDGDVWIINKELFDLYSKNFNVASRSVTLFYNDPKFHFYKQRLQPQCTIFDLIDNPVDEFAEWQLKLKVAVSEADIVTYSSKYLETVLKKVNPNKQYTFIGNGCDFPHFNVAVSPLLPKPVEMINLPDKPVLGYYGAISTWLDFELIKKIADLDDCVHVVMIGGIKSVPSYNMTFYHKNITWIDHIDYKDVPRYLSWFSFCMIPFKQKEMIKGCNPIKFYECYAAGKIVIGSDFGDIDTFYYKIDNDNYEMTVRNIVKNCDLRVARKDHIQYALANSWQNSVNKLLDVVKIDYTVVYPPLISYDFLMQRPTQFMRSFGKNLRIRSVFVDKSYNVQEKVNYKFMILNRATFNSRIKYFIKGKLIFYYTYPNNIEYKQMLNPDYTVFDLIDNPTDEFQSWNNDNLYKSVRECDLFICSAQIMYDKFKAYNKNSIIVSNGCDYAHFKGSTTKLNKINKTKTVIGYYGAHASWVDFELIRKIADYKPDQYTVMMIGKSKIYDNSFVHKNIVWIDHQSYDNLPKFLSVFDICMIPFKLTEMIKGCDPIKFYEYLAAGKPVISTEIEPLMKYKQKNICNFINHKNYGKVLDDVFNSLSNQKLVKHRHSIAYKHSWDVKATRILNCLTSKLIKTTVVYPPYIVWNKMYQRPQQMCTALSKISNVRCVFIDYSRRNVETVTESLIIVGSYEQAKQYVEGKVVLYYNNPSTVKELHKYKCDKVIFELVDNPVEEFGNWRTDLNDAIKRADAVSITSTAMSSVVSKVVEKFTVLPNAADFKHFKRAQVRLEKPNDFPTVSSNKKIVGYYGAHAPWVDWDLIRKIADLSSVHVVMIGKMEKVYNLSFNHENITWLPVKQYDELPNYLSWFDICMIPFKLTEMIKGCDPIKFYEYCSAGKPVLATDMEELKKFSSVTYTVNRENYDIVLQKALNEMHDTNKINDRQKVAKLNSWSERATSLLNLV